MVTTEHHRLQNLLSPCTFAPESLLADKLQHPLWVAGAHVKGRNKPLIDPPHVGCAMLQPSPQPGTARQAQGHQGASVVSEHVYYCACLVR